MPLNGKVGDTYVCLTCGTTYRHLTCGWTLSGPIVDLAPELQQDPDPLHDADRIRAERWYETTLDQDERTGN
jgi:hypothetical protein